MTEQEYKIFRDKYSRLKEQIKARPTGETPEELRQIHYAITSFSPAIADIARQLTRIAEHTELEAYCEECGLKVITGEKPPPADDALVEAVRNHLTANDAKCIGRLTDDEMQPLRDAFAAHKQVVT